MTIISRLINSTKNIFNRTGNIPEKEKTIELDIVMGKDPKTKFTKNAKAFSIIKGQRTLLRFPFDFKVRKVGSTSFKNLPTPYGILDAGTMFQIINEEANQQISLKVPHECMLNGKLIEENGNYNLYILDDYQVGIHPKVPDVLICIKQ
jgi:hypothetical protein